MTCQKPCPECPWRTQSTPGYLGGNSVNAFTNNLEGDPIHVCHTRGAHLLGKEDTVGAPLNEGTMCIGFMLAKLNDMRQARDPELLALERKYADVPEREEVFKFPSIIRFKSHHGN